MKKEASSETQAKGGEEALRRRRPRPGSEEPIVVQVRRGKRSEKSQGGGRKGPGSGGGQGGGRRGRRSQGGRAEGRSPARSAPAPRQAAGTATSRELAAEILLQLMTEPYTRASELLAHHLPRLERGQEEGASQNVLLEKALATELVYGVIRWRDQLSYLLRKHVKQDFHRLEPEAQVLLLLGAYQIFELDKIPGPIAVASIQDTARNMGLGRLTGLLNAVLRKVAGTSKPEFRDGALMSSFPKPLYREIKQRFGKRAKSEAMALKERPELYLRPNQRKISPEALQEKLKEASFESSIWLPDEALAKKFGLEGKVRPMLKVEGGHVFGDPLYLEGYFMAQDPASHLVVDWLLKETGAKEVLDLCAGRGVKATSFMEAGAEVTALDLSPRKLEELQKTAKRLGLLEQMKLLHPMDPTTTAVPEELGLFDLSFVDAPCSGLGTLRRHPEIAWRFRAEDIPALAETQALLLEAASKTVKPGGYLAYAVCTFTEEECTPRIPEGWKVVKHLNLPPTSGMDGFYAALYQRL